MDPHLSVPTNPVWTGGPMAGWGHFPHAHQGTQTSGYPTYAGYPYPYPGPGAYGPPPPPPPGQYPMYPGMHPGYGYYGPPPPHPGGMPYQPGHFHASPAAPGGPPPPPATATIPPVNDQIAAIAFAFNQAWRDFAYVLSCRFKQASGVTDWQAKIDSVLTTDPATDAYVRAFSAAAHPFRQDLLDRKETVLLDDSISEFKTISLSVHWPSLSETEKSRIWDRIQNLSNHAEVFHTHSKHPILQKASGKMLEHWRKTGFDVKAALQGGRQMDVIFSAADMLEGDNEMKQHLKSAMRAFSDPTSESSLEDLETLFSPEQKAMIEALKAQSLEQEDDDDGEQESDADDAKEKGSKKNQKAQKKAPKARREKSTREKEEEDQELDETLDKFFNLMHNVKKGKNMFSALRKKKDKKTAPVSEPSSGVAPQPVPESPAKPST